MSNQHNVFDSTLSDIEKLNVCKNYIKALRQEIAELKEKIREREHKLPPKVKLHIAIDSRVKELTTTNEKLRSRINKLREDNSNLVNKLSITQVKELY